MSVCGRPTRSNTPCKAGGLAGGYPCRMHATEKEIASYEGYSRGYSEGCSRGREMGRSLNSYTIERLEERIADLTKTLDAQIRYYEYEGDQVVEVGSYTYRWDDPDKPLQVGDTVLLPANWLFGQTEGVVTALGGTYTGGPISTIVRRLDR